MGSYSFSTTGFAATITTTAQTKWVDSETFALPAVTMNITKNQDTNGAEVRVRVNGKAGHYYEGSTDYGETDVYIDGFQTGKVALTDGSTKWKASDVPAAGAYSVTVTVEGGGKTQTFTTDVKVQRRQYAVSYDANGGTGAPASQVKSYGLGLTLSNTKPTRSDHYFRRWSTAADGGGTGYSAGASYTADAAATLYAQWAESPAVTDLALGRATSGGKPDRFGDTLEVTADWTCDSGALPATVKVAANGEAKTFTYGDAESMKDGFTVASFGGIETDRSYPVTVTVTDANGESATKTPTSSVDYHRPTVSGLSVTRCDSTGALDDEGTFALVAFDWSISPAGGAQGSPRSCTVEVGDDFRYVSLTGLSGHASTVVGAASGGSGPFSTDESYICTATVADRRYSASASDQLTVAFFTMDFLGAGLYDPATGQGPRPGHGVSFGAPARREGFNVSMPLFSYEERCYPTFARASWSTSSDESALPVTPCFVLDTSDGGLYWCDGE